MKNPLDMWKDLPRNGKIAVVVGVVAISVLLYYRKKKAAATAAQTDQTGQSTDQSTGAATDGSASTGVDPNSYNDASLDPSGSPAYGMGLDPSYGYGGMPAGGMGGGFYGGDGVGPGPGTPIASGPPDSTTAVNSPGEIGPIDVNIEAPSTTGGGAPVRPHPGHAHTVHRKPPGHDPHTNHHAGVDKDDKPKATATHSNTHKTTAHKPKAPARKRRR